MWKFKINDKFIDFIHCQKNLHVDNFLFYVLRTKKFHLGNFNSLGYTSDLNINDALFCPVCHELVPEYIKLQFKLLF